MYEPAIEYFILGRNLPNATLCLFVYFSCKEFVDNFKKNILINNHENIFVPHILLAVLVHRF